MSILDDSVLALIARFVVDDLEKLSVSDELFLQQQIQEIKTHIQGVPKDQQQQVILSWIEEHAERYRKQWQKQTISKLLKHKRCSDCPLIDDGSRNCVIHEKWIDLLNDYLYGELDSDHYVKESLKLLETHKQKLKIAKYARELA